MIDNYEEAILNNLLSLGFSQEPAQSQSPLYFFLLSNILSMFSIYASAYCFLNLSTGSA